MRILITGATGFVGRHLARSLHEKKHDVRVLARAPDAAKRALPFAESVWRWDGAGEPPLEAFAGIEAVVHLAGESIAKGRWTEARKKALRDSRILSTRNLLAALVRSKAEPEVLICASAVGIYGDRGEEILSEESAPGSGFLADLCREWEAASRLGPKSMRVVNLRTGVVLGDGGFLDEVKPIFKMGLGGKLGSGNQWMSWIHISDLTRLVEAALLNRNFNGPLNAVSPGAVRNREMTKALAKALHRPSLFPAPGFALKMALGEMSEMLLSSQRAGSDKAEKLGFKFQYPEITGALAQIMP